MTEALAAYLFGSFAGIVLILALAIVWIVLPFAVIGTKPLLRKIIEQQAETNRLLGVISGKALRE